MIFLPDHSFTTAGISHGKGKKLQLGVQGSSQKEWEYFGLKMKISNIFFESIVKK
jgi:hypothetical protein